MAFDLEQFVREAFESPTNPGHALPFQPLPDIVGGIGGVVGDVSTFLTGAGLSGVVTAGVTKALELFLKELSENGYADALVKLVLRVFKIIVDHFGEIFQFVIDQFEKLAKIVLDAFTTLIQKLEGPLRDLVNRMLEKVLQSIPGVLREGPLEAVKAVSDIKRLLEAVGALEGVTVRAAVVGRSVEELAKVLIGQKDAESVSLFGMLVGTPVKTFESAWQAADPMTLWTGLAKDVIFPKGAAGQVLKAIFEQRLWAWGGLPGGPAPGDLNDWLNDPARYAAEHRPLARQFRARLVAAADAYLRRTPAADPNLATTLTRSDERSGPQLVADVLCVFIDTVVTFVLEPDCFPVIDLEVDGFEDVGVKLAGLVARQLRVTVRATISLLLRGFWVWTVNNELLIELVATFFSAIFSAVIEAVVRNLTWSLRVMSCYSGAAVGPADFVVHRWKSLETVENSDAEADRLEYVALVRASRFQLDGPARANLRGLVGDEGNTTELKVIKGLVRDLGAYLDVSYQRFRVENRFPAVAADEVFITRAEIDPDAGRLYLFATTTAKFELPQPVLRAYFCCHVAALRPGPSPADAYTLELPLDFVPPRCLDVTVLSNRGGRATRPVVRV